MESSERPVCSASNASSEKTDDRQSKKRRTNDTPQWFELDDEHNPYIYVTNLPKTMTEEEFIDLMKKYGVLKMKDVQRGLYNIKMYKDSDGNFKGDATCCYVRVESVQLALMHLDGLNYDGTHIIHAERAKFQQKGDYDPNKRPRKATKKDKLKEKKRLDKLLSWQPDKLAAEKPKAHLTVILSNMFEPSKLKEEPTLILEIREDVESLCNEDCGPVHKVIVYDQHVDGVVTVKFKDFESAEKCVQKLNNLVFDGRLVKAELWDGKTRYKVEESAQDEAARVAKWQQDIEREDPEESGAANSLSDLNQPNKSNNHDDSSPIDKPEEEDDLVDPLEGIEDWDDDS